MGYSMEILKEITFFDLTNWSVQYLLDTAFSYNQNFNLVKIDDFLTRNKTQIIIQDNIDYKRVTIKVRNGGVFLRDILKGNLIGTKKQFLIKKGQFLLSKIDARNGAFGVVPSEVDGAIITGNFWTFDVNYEIINPHFLSLIVTTSEFIKFCENASNGTTNRHYLQEDLFLDQKIPLPPLTEQNRIVANNNAKIKLANEQEQKAKQLEQEIENYLFEVLGIEKLENKENVKGLQFVHFKNLDRWDVLAKDLRILNGLANCKYELKKIGKVFDFLSRSWKKKEYKKDTFKYIELGAIDPTNGISELKEIKVKNAPSRATQEVKTGDLLIGTTRPYLKRFVIIEPEYEGNICSSGFSIIAPSSNYNLFYLKEFLMSYFGLEQLKNRMTGGTYPAITNNELKEILVPFPKIEIQNQIANHISTIKQQIKKLQTQAKENRKKAIQEFEEVKLCS